MESQLPPKLRFAVGIFDSWERLRAGVSDLGTRDFRIGNVNCLGLLRVFARQTTIAAAPWRHPLRIREFVFPGNSGLIACTSGTLAERLGQAAQVGAASLRPSRPGFCPGMQSTSKSELRRRTSNCGSP
jgi:hypothetical protein